MILREMIEAAEKKKILIVGVSSRGNERSIEGKAD
jgi:hypothetical protein